MKRINSTRFLSQEEFAKCYMELDMNQKKYPAGGVPLMVQENKIYIDNTDSHTIIFGATGSKKTRNFVMPSVGIFARAGESFVVTDPKGEIFEKTSAEVQNYGYNIACLNLREFENGIAWNPLALAYKYYHNRNRTKALELVSEMARMIIDEDSTDEAFWNFSARDTLIGLMLFLFEEFDEKECNLKNLCNLWMRYLRSHESVLGTVSLKYKDMLIHQKLSYLFSKSDKTVGSIETIVSMGINRLANNEEFMNFLAMPGIDIESLAEGKQAIYLIIPDENTTYHFVASLFLEQLYEVLIQQAQQEASNMLRTRMNFLIDEFANIPKIENMDSMITASRSRNIRFHLIVQGMKQLREKYDEAAEIITGNCNNWIYLYSKEFELLQDISNLCGEVFYDNNIKMPLFSTFELQHLNKEQGETLVLSGRNYPCLTNLADISQYPYLQEMATNYPTVNGKKSRIQNRKNNGNRFSLMPKPEKIAAKSYIFKSEKNIWLVAVGPKGMIFSEEMVTEKELAQGAVIGKMACELVKEMKCELEFFEWYSAPKSVGVKYRELMAEEPENVYLTITELGLSNFKKEKSFANEAIRIPNEKPHTIKLSIQDDSLYTRRNQEVFCKEISRFSGVTGLHYAYNVMFREANKKLKGTLFQKTPWVEVEEPGSATVFVKRIDKKAQAVLKLY